jgi:hypothetical protein
MMNLVQKERVWRYVKNPSSHLRTKLKMRSGKRHVKTSTIFLGVYGGTRTDCKIPQGISENKTTTCTGIPFPKNTPPFFICPVIPATYPPGITGKRFFN